MTAEEAIDILDRCVIGDCELCVNNERHCGHCKGSDYAFSAIAEAQKALEKQIPKKPLHMHKNYYCPICKEDGWMLWDDAIPNDMDKYCGICGQAIDWEDDNGC